MKKLIAVLLVALMTMGCLSAVAESSLLEDYAEIPNDVAEGYVERTSFTVSELSKSYTFAYIAGTLGSAYFYVGPNATKTYLESLDCTCLISDANADLATQVNQIENAITQKVDAIIINTVDPPAGVSEALQKAAEAGIPVVAVDSSLDAEFSNYMTYISSDNFQLGYECGVYAANYLMDTKGAVEGVCCVMDGIEGNFAATGRYDGFWAGVASVDPDHKLVESSRLFGGSWTEEAGLQEAEDMLVANPHIDVMFGISDPFVTGAVTAAERVGRDEMIMVAVDGQKAALRLLKDGSPIKCIACQDPQGMGLIAANLLLNYMEDGTLPAGRTLRVKPVVATPETIDDVYDEESDF